MAKEIPFSNELNLICDRELQNFMDPLDIRVKEWFNVEKIGNLKAYISVFSV